MGYDIVLFFDPPTWQRIEDLRNGISQAAGNGRSRPHITLALFDILEHFEPAIRILERFSRTVFPFDIKLESVGCFPAAEGVMFLSPVATRHLLDVHESLHRLLD